MRYCPQPHSKRDTLAAAAPGGELHHWHCVPHNTCDLPQATYNLQNSPHLRPAFVLDRVVKRLARDIGEGAWVERGIPKVTVLQCFKS